MKKISIVILMFIVVIIAFFGQYRGLFNNVYNALSYEEGNLLDVSIINLISNPKKFNGKHIRLEGILEWEFESHSVYLTRDDYNYGITKNAIWLDTNEEEFFEKSDDLNKMNGKYVIIEGVFNSGENGHFDMYSGAIENVTRMELWKSRDERIQNSNQN